MGELALKGFLKPMTAFNIVGLKERQAAGEEASAGAGPGEHLAGLTEREIDVLRLVAQGLTNAQVAEQLILSPLTINAHLRSIFSKLGVTSRSAATRWAVDQGLV